MNTFQCMRLGSHECDAAVALVIAELPADLRSGSELRPTRVSRLVLQHTADNGQSQLEVELTGQRTREHRQGHRVVWPATLGATYYVEATTDLPPDVASRLFPKADGSASKTATTSASVAVVVYAAGTYGSDNRLALTEVRVTRAVETDPRSAAVPASEHPGLTIMSFNVWNTNPPHWLMPGKDRVERYVTDALFVNPPWLDSCFVSLSQLTCTR
jgi:hypothetical protein